MEIVIEAIKYLLLGIIQGVTEVLPISSSGHVALFESIFNLRNDEGVLFLILVNTGSFLTFLIIYWKRLIELIRDFIKYVFNKESRNETFKNFRYTLLVILGCIPIGIAGLLLESSINSILLGAHGLLLVGLGFTISGAVLYLIRNANVNEGRTEIEVKDALVIGVVQAVAVLPGVSRSGMTSSSGIKNGVSINAALNFSFIMYLPLSLATILLSVYRLTTEGAGSLGYEYILYYGLAFIGAMVATYFAYKLIFNIFRSGKLRYFSYYLFAVALISLLFYFLSR